MARAVSALSPLLMVIFPSPDAELEIPVLAVALGPVAVDVLFTVAHVVVTDVFPEDTHAMAGAVFNAVAHLGTSAGMTADGCRGGGEFGEGEI